jgi:glycosyltransferase involved in cell wall biosynthesis
MTTPRVSIVIPVHNGGPAFAACVDALAGSPAHEVIVVDDRSSDGSPELAARIGARIVASAGPGPAQARNTGAGLATGDVILFLDADVAVHADTVARVRDAFLDPTLDAIIGSYDDDPGSRDFLSQYRNLLHCYVHQTSSREASTFWSGCGAIRRDVFLAAGGFDAGYERPAIEDIELGYRLTREGRRIALDPGLRVKHLKRWTFWRMLGTDIFDRGVPWTELILRDRNLPNDLNLRLSQRVSLGLVWLMLLGAAACAVYFGGWILTPLFAVVFFLLARYWSDGSDRPRAATITMLGSAAALAGLAWSQHLHALIPPIAASLVPLLVPHRYSGFMDGRPWLRRSLIGIYTALVAAAVWIYLPGHFLIGALFLGAVLVIGLNSGFYLFLASRRGRAFAAGAIPFHLLYHFYNGISVLIGVVRWAFAELSGRRRERTS